MYRLQCRRERGSRRPLRLSRWLEETLGFAVLLSNLHSRLTAFGGNGDRLRVGLEYDDREGGAHDGLSGNEWLGIFEGFMSAR